MADLWIVADEMYKVIGKVTSLAVSLDGWRSEVAAVQHGDAKHSPERIALSLRVCADLAALVATDLRVLADQVSPVSGRGSDGPA